MFVTRIIQNPPREIVRRCDMDQMPTNPSSHFRNDQDKDLVTALLKISQVHWKKWHLIVFSLHKSMNNTETECYKKRNTNSSLAFWEWGINNIPLGSYSECVLLRYWRVYKIAGICKGLCKGWCEAATSSPFSHQTFDHGCSFTSFLL